MSALARAWRRFRGLPAAVQAVSALALLAVYTVVLVVILSGGDDGGSAPEKRQLSAIENKVKTEAEKSEVPQRDRSDISGFRTPEVSDVRCTGQQCTVVYTVAVPGRGRILLQQVDMMGRVFDTAGVDRVVMRVIRGLPSGPNASPPGQEETNKGATLYVTTCDRSKYTKDVDWRSYQDESAAFTTICKSQFFNPGGPGGLTGPPNGVPGGS